MPGRLLEKGRTTFSNAEVLQEKQYTGNPPEIKLEHCCYLFHAAMGKIV